MTATIVLFFILSIALLLLAVLLLWFVPHLLQQQEHRAAREATRLRELLSDMLGEQEAVALRQAQLGTSLSYLQDQIEQLTTSWPTTVDDLMTMPDEGGRQHMLGELNERILSLQQQLDAWMQQRNIRHTYSQRDNESWANLMGLLSAMQGRLGEIERARQRLLTPPGSSPPGAGQTAHPIDELELEQRLRSIADDLVALRWRLQRTAQPHVPQLTLGAQHGAERNGTGKARAAGEPFSPH